MTPRPLLAEVLVRALYPLLLLAAAWLLLRGHNAPGGGFVAGLVAAAASAAWAMTFGAAQAAARMPLGPERLATLGVLVALASGLPWMLAGRPFLSHPWLEIPFGVAALPVSTVLVFDLGVFLCVWGALGGFCLALVRDGEARA